MLLLNAIQKGIANTVKIQNIEILTKIVTKQNKKNPTTNKTTTKVYVFFQFMWKMRLETAILDTAWK